MKIAIISDIHEHFPVIHDGIDVALFPGDFCSSPNGIGKWLKREAEIWRVWIQPYIKEIRARGITTVGMPGNHDFYPQSSKRAFREVASYFDVFVTQGLVSIHGFSFYFFCHNKLEEYAYYLDQTIAEERVNNLSGRQPDFLVTHTPPYDILSVVPSWGSMPILHLAEKQMPKHLHIFGHCHSDRGYTKRGQTTFVNGSYCAENNRSRGEYLIYDTMTKSIELQTTTDIKEPFLL